MSKGQMKEGGVEARARDVVHCWLGWTGSRVETPRTGPVAWDEDGMMEIREVECNFGLGGQAVMLRCGGQALHHGRG